jgi:hypothetical protein
MHGSVVQVKLGSKCEDALSRKGGPTDKLPPGASKQVVADAIKGELGRQAVLKKAFGAGVGLLGVSELQDILTDPRYTDEQKDQILAENAAAEDAAAAAAAAAAADDAADDAAGPTRSPTRSPTRPPTGTVVDPTGTVVDPTGTVVDPTAPVSWRCYAGTAAGEDPPKATERGGGISEKNRILIELGLRVAGDPSPVGGPLGAFARAGLGALGSSAERDTAAEERKFKQATVDYQNKALEDAARESGLTADYRKQALEAGSAERLASTAAARHAADLTAAYRRADLEATAAKNYARQPYS